MFDTTTADIAECLGLQNRASLSPLGLIEQIEHGLSVESLSRVSRQIAPDDQSFAYRIVPKATLSRRKRQDAPLSAEESGRLARLAGVWAAAIDVWKEPETVRTFLFRPHPLLGNRSPIDLALGTDLGAQMVEQLLGRLKYGSAA